MVHELAKSLGKADSEISKMVSDGKIGFEDVKKVLFNLTNEGGIFFNLMEKQSKSLSGKIANLGDAWDQMLNKIGTANEGLLANSIDGLAYLVDNYEEVVKILTVLVVTYGSYKAALIATSVIQKSLAFAEQFNAAMRLAQGISGMTKAQILFNAAASANPIGAIAAVIGLVVSSYVLYGDELKRIIGITKELNTVQKVQAAVDEELKNKFTSGVAEKKTAIAGLIDVIRNERATLKQREDAYNKLIAIDSSFRNTLDAQYKATRKLGDAFDYVSKKMDEYARAQAMVAVKSQKMQEYVSAQFNAGNVKLQLDEVSKQIDAIRSKGRDGMKWFQVSGDLPELLERQKKLTEQYNDLKNIAKEAGSVFNGTNAQIRKQTQELEKGVKVIEAQLRGGKIKGKVMSAEQRARLEAELKDQKERMNVLIGVNVDVAPTLTPESKGLIEKLEDEIEEIKTKKKKSNSKKEIAQ